MMLIMRLLFSAAMILFVTPRALAEDGAAPYLSVSCDQARQSAELSIHMVLDSEPLLVAKGEYSAYRWQNYQDQAPKIVCALKIPISVNGGVSSKNPFNDNLAVYAGASFELGRLYYKVDDTAKITVKIRQNSEIDFCIKEGPTFSFSPHSVSECFKSQIDRSGKILPAVATGFDCGLAITPIEVEICRTDATALADAEVVEAYRKLSYKFQNEEDYNLSEKKTNALKADQEAWLRERSACMAAKAKAVSTPAAKPAEVTSEAMDRCIIEMSNARTAHLSDQLR